jgi:hypothetical protein
MKTPQTTNEKKLLKDQKFDDEQKLVWLELLLRCYGSENTP